MAITFYLSGTDSDLSGGTNFNKQLKTTTETTGTISQTLSNSATVINYGFTNSGIPGVGGISTGTFTIRIRVSSANSNIDMSVALARVNSSGTQQAVTSYTVAQTASTVATYTFSFTDPALGTWASGDRLRIQYRFVNTAMNNQSIDISTGATTTAADTPFYPASATLYWVGGAGTWDTNTPTNWAATSGGTGGYSFPLSTTDVLFDSSSDSGTGFTVTVSTGAVCKNITVSGLDQTMTLAGSATLNVSGNLSFPASNLTLTYTGTLTFPATSGTQTITTNGLTLDFPVSFTGAGGTRQLSDNLTVGSTRTVTLTAGTLDLNTKTLSTGLFASSNSNTRTLAFSASGQLALTGNAATIFDVSTATNFSTTGTVYVNSTYTGSTGTRTFNTGFSQTQANAGYIVATSGSSGIVIGTTATDTVALTGNYASIDLSGFTNTLSNTARTIYGDFTLPAAGGTLTVGSNTTTFAATSGTKTITTNGRTVPNPLVFNGVGGTFQLQDDLTSNDTSGAAYISLSAGTFDANNKNVTVRSCSITGTSTRTFTMGSGLWTLKGTGTVWDATTTTNLTFNKNTANILLSDTSATARTFAGGGLTYNKLTIGGTTGTSTLTFTGSNTFSELASTKTVAHTITFTAGTTTTVAAWAITGTSGNVVTLNSSNAGSAYTLALSGGGYTTGIDYLSIRDPIGSPVSDTWYVGSNSTIVTTAPNRGYGLFTTQRADNVVIVLTSTSSTTWTVPTDWNNSSNEIHLIGGGGGGSGGKGNILYSIAAGGGGGGGGGYTKLTNQTLTPSSSITYQCGTAGAGGAGGANGSNGGTTSWNSSAATAGGGDGGSCSASAPPATSTGGTGGTGTTYNGGNGGAGGAGTLTNHGAGGGGGAGGPNGNGGNGGAGVTAGTFSGGGGGNGGGTNGANATGSASGAGGNNSSGDGGGAVNVDGAVGGGGGGGSASPGSGGNGIEVFGVGGGGGSGGKSTTSAWVSVGGTFGGGGGGGYRNGSNNTNAAGFNGYQGAIIITYVPSAVTQKGYFFSMFGS